MAISELDRADRLERMFGVGEAFLLEDPAVADGIEVISVWQWPCHECGAAVFDTDVHFDWHLKLDNITG